jgi:hypothetical protein
MSAMQFTSTGMTPLQLTNGAVLFEDVVEVTDVLQINRFVDAASNIVYPCVSASQSQLTVATGQVRTELRFVSLFILHFGFMLNLSE